MKHLLVGAAILALAAGPLAAQGNGHGKGPPHAQDKAAHAPTMQGPSMKPSMKSSAKPAERGRPKREAGSTASMQPAAPRHGEGKAQRAGKNPAEPKATAARARPAMAYAERGEPRRENDKGRPRAAAAAALPGVKVLQDGRRYYTSPHARQAFDFASVRRDVIAGCPPGLARKGNGCQPPGLAKQRTYGPDWWGLGTLAGGSYAYDQGYLLRLDGDEVAGYVPLLGGALAPGKIWPSAYPPQPVPEYYLDYYDLGSPDSYRYADDVLYRVDPATSAITSIAALLTGDTFRIGSPLPPGYDVYNVPYPYRSQYPDGPDALYRYSDGYIYQVDPTTQLITAAIDLLTAS
jgi:hypothetical protein